MSCIDMVKSGCDCEEAEAAFIEYLNTGVLSIKATCFYEEIQELSDE